MKLVPERKNHQNSGNHEFWNHEMQGSPVHKWSRHGILLNFRKRKTILALFICIGQHLEFSTTSASNPALIEWKWAPSCFTQSLADQRLTMNLAMQIAKFWLSKLIFYVKNHPNPSKKIFIGEYKIRSTHFEY